MPAREPFQFKVPSLPKNVYDFVRQTSEATGVSHWHVLLMSLRLLSQLEPEARDVLRDSIVSRYPYPGAPSCR